MSKRGRGKREWGGAQTRTSHLIWPRVVSKVAMGFGIVSCTKVGCDGGRGSEMGTRCNAGDRHGVGRVGQAVPRSLPIGGGVAHAPKKKGGQLLI